VSPEIRTGSRHTVPYVTLISPPPHHDIYSIEDLAQLIYDLKSVNPRRTSREARLRGRRRTIAAGVAKAKADLVLIAGSDGGTGASPLTSIKHTGLPWELGLAETQQALIYNRLRDRIRVQVDGQLKTGRDLAIAALMGAEEFGFGTAVLVSLGCIMMRACHLNTCPVGVATQDPVLRARFGGAPSTSCASSASSPRSCANTMAELGFRTLDEMVGRVDRLEVQPAVEHWKAKGLDFSAILLPPDKRAAQPAALQCVRRSTKSEKPSTTRSWRSPGAPWTGKSRSGSRCRSGTSTGRSARRSPARSPAGTGRQGLPDDTIHLTLFGSAGQSFGAFLAPGVTMHVHGDANDYLGKGMSGGRIVVTPPEERPSSRTRT